MQQPVVVGPPQAVPTPTPVQSQLFATRAWSFIPATGGSADASGDVEADDGFRYLVKRDVQGVPVRASEWLCTRLAQQIGIVGPPHTIVEMPNGEKVFGSRYIAGVAARVDTDAYLLTPTLTTTQSANTSGPATGANSATPSAPPAAVVSAPTLQSLLSSIYAFDLAIGNEDRHLGNYLSVEVANTKRLYAFDYSRALFFTWPMQGFPLAWTKYATGPSNTLNWGRQLRLAHGFDLASAVRTVERLEQVGVATIKSFISEMPADWLPQPQHDDFVQWWTDGRRKARLNDLRKGLNDASLL